jgi:hypothetical protein
MLLCPEPTIKIHAKILAIYRQDTHSIGTIVEHGNIVLVADLRNRFYVMHVTIQVIHVVDEGKDGCPAELFFFTSSILKAAASDVTMC